MFETTEVPFIPNHFSTIPIYILKNIFQKGLEVHIFILLKIKFISIYNFLFQEFALACGF